MRKGKIVGFYGCYGSGIAELSLIEHVGEKNISIRIPCENAPTVRALDSAFPGFISDGHSVDTQVIRNKEIEFEVTDYGILAGFNLPGGEDLEQER